MSKRPPIGVNVLDSMSRRSLDETIRRLYRLDDSKAHAMAGELKHAVKRGSPGRVMVSDSLLLQISSALARERDRAARHLRRTLDSAVAQARKRQAEADAERAAGPHPSLARNDGAIRRTTRARHQPRSRP